MYRYNLFHRFLNINSFFPKLNKKQMHQCWIYFSSSVDSSSLTTNVPVIQVKTPDIAMKNPAAKNASSQRCVRSSYLKIKNKKSFFIELIR